MTENRNRLKVDLAKPVKFQQRPLGFADLESAVLLVVIFSVSVNFFLDLTSCVSFVSAILFGFPRVFSEFSYTFCSVSKFCESSVSLHSSVSVQLFLNVLFKLCYRIPKSCRTFLQEGRGMVAPPGWQNMSSPCVNRSWSFPVPPNCFRLSFCSSPPFFQDSSIGTCVFIAAT